VTTGNLVPNTYFLEDAADLARGSILARLDPALAYQPFFRLDLGGEVPEARHASWDYCDMAGRFVDALILTAPMVGAGHPGEAEEGLRAFLLSRANPRDGLFYDGDAPWSTYAADMFCQGRVLLGLVSWYLLTGDPVVEERLDGLIDGLSRLAVWDGDTCSYPTDIRIEGRWAEGGLWKGAAPGYAAQQLVGLARYAKATGSPKALNLASGLARHFAGCGVVNPDGTFKGHTHSQGILPSVLGVLTYARVAGDGDLAAWCGRVYEHARRHTSAFGWLPDGLGFEPEENFFAGTCETCALTDLIELAITLTEAGLGDYWDDVERFARNQLLEQQVRDATKAVPADALARSTTPVAQILSGAFDSCARPNSLLGDRHGVVEGCCTPAGARACFLVWDRIVTRRPDGVYVNLAFSRDAPEVRVISAEPYRGELRLEVRQAGPYFLRLPEWAEPESVRLTVDGVERPAERQGRYLALGTARPGQAFVATYPLPVREQTETIAGNEYTTRWKGGTVTRITPPGERYPTYERAHFEATEAPLVEREPEVRPVVVSW
jgi:DUF1680 family protein